MMKEVEVGKKQFWFEEHFKIGRVCSSVPAVSDMATVHDFTKDVLEIFPWHYVVLAKIVMEHISTDGQVTSVE